MVKDFIKLYNSQTKKNTMAALASPDFDFDLFVIGCGSGGIRAGRIAATHGARVAIADDLTKPSTHKNRVV